MGTSTSPGTELPGHPLAAGPLPAIVDWVLAALVVLGGLLSTMLGGALVGLVDRALIEEHVESGTITVTAGTSELTGAEAVEVVAAIAWWSGIGLLATGLAMVALGSWFAVARRRTHRRARAGEAVGSFWTVALLGGLATALLSFLPFSPVIGGALAGYLERGESERTTSVGALAGVVPALPLLAVLAFTLVGLVAGMLAVGQPAVAIVLGVVLLFVVAFAAALAGGLGALGGWAGGRLAERGAGH